MTGQRIGHATGIVKLSEFEQQLGNTRIHNSLIIKHSSFWPEGENQPALTEVDNTLVLLANECKKSFP